MSAAVPRSIQTNKGNYTSMTHRTDGFSPWRPLVAVCKYCKYLCIWANNSVTCTLYSKYGSQSKLAIFPRKWRIPKTFRPPSCEKFVLFHPRTMQNRLRPQIPRRKNILQYSKKVLTDGGQMTTISTNPNTPPKALEQKE